MKKILLLTLVLSLSAFANAKDLSLEVSNEPTSIEIANKTDNQVIVFAQCNCYRGESMEDVIKLADGDSFQEAVKNAHFACARVRGFGNTDRKYIVKPSQCKRYELNPETGLYEEYENNETEE